MFTHNTLKRLFTGALSASLLVTAMSGAYAADPLPADLLSGKAAVKLQPMEGDIQQLQVTKVQPILLSDSGARNQVSAIFSVAANLKTDDAQKARITGAAPAITMPAADGEQGFGFGGSSTELDIVSLQYGYLLGMLPLLQASSPDKFKETVTMFDSLAELNGFYGPEAQAAIKTFVGDAKQGKLNDKAYMEMITGATQGMASATDPSVERRHGYLLLGLWSGLTTLAVEAGAVPENLAASGNTLVMLLEKDAAFGGSDVQLAAKLKLVIAGIKAATPDKAAVQQHIQSMFSVEADKK
jgi:hypothetical protein